MPLPAHHPTRPPGIRLAAAGLLTLLALATGCATGPSQPATPAAGPAMATTEPTGEQSPRLDAADAARQSGNYEVALAMFRDLLAENPTMTSAYLGLGRTHDAMGNFTESERDYRRAAQLEPRNYDAQFGHGVALRMLRRFKEAIDAFFRALTIRPDSFEANLNIALTYLETDQPSGAVIFAEKAVELRADDPQARINLGAIYERLGRYTDAIREYEVALELTSATPELLSSLLNCLASMGRYHEAINTADYLLTLEPNANAWERKGWAHFRLREYDKSLHSYRQAVRLDDQHWVAFRGIGVNSLNAYLLSGRNDRRAADEARTAFRRSLRINREQPKVVRLMTTYEL